MFKAVLIAASAIVTCTLAVSVCSPGDIAIGIFAPSSGAVSRANCLQSEVGLTYSTLSGRDDLGQQL